jgi:prephenate dehydrogenase
VWLDILQSNRPAVATELRALQERLNAVLAALEGGDDAALRRFLEEGRAARRALRDKINLRGEV